MAKAWSLIAWNVPPAASGLMARLRMRVSCRAPTTFWRTFPDDDRFPVIAAIELLREAGIHGIAKREEVRNPHRAPSFSTGGFGGILNATPVRSAYRMRKRRH